MTGEGHRITDSDRIDPASIPAGTRALVLERCSGDLGFLAQLPELERLTLIATEVPTLAPIAKLGELRWLILVGCPLPELAPVLELAKLARLVVRAVPLSGDSFHAVLPSLQARAGLRCDAPTALQWMLGLDVFDAGAGVGEGVDDERAIVFFPGATPRLVGGPFFVPNPEFMIHAQSVDDPDAIVEWVRAHGSPAQAWVDALLDEAEAGSTTAEIVEQLGARDDLAIDARASLERFAGAFPALAFSGPAARGRRSPADAHPMVAALMDTLGRWSLASAPEVEITEGKPASSWWRWDAEGCWGGADVGPAGEPAIGLAVDDARGRGLWVDASADGDARVWVAPSEDHDPGGQLDPETAEPFATLAELLDRICAVRLGDGRVLARRA